MSFLLAMFISLSSPSVQAEPLSKVDKAVLNAMLTQKKADVVIYLRQKADLSGAEKITNRTERIRFVYEALKANAKKSQAGLIQQLQNNKSQFQPFFIQNAVAVYGADMKSLQLAQADANVVKVGLNARVKLKTILPTRHEKLTASTDLPSHITAMGVDKAWNELGVKGKGIVIAGQDTGYYWDHNAIKKQYRGYKADGTVDHNYNWHDSIAGTKSLTPMDDSGHGTHTMGSMLGDDGTGKNRIGMAPEAKWMGCRNMDNGFGTPATYLECFQFLMAPYPVGGNPQTDGKPEYAPHIISNSWGCPSSEGCGGNEFIDSVKAMKAAGIYVVVAAGNEGSACESNETAPNFYSGDVLIVGAFNGYTKDIAYFSSRGASKWNGGLAPNVVGYGVGVRSSVPGNPDNYEEMSGTSMATPLVAGVVALLWSAKPELIGQIDKTTEILQNTATPYKSGQSCGNFKGSSVPNAVFGYGLVNAYNAIKSVGL